MLGGAGYGLGVRLFSTERNDRAKSLAEYRKKYEPRVSVKASLNNVSGDQVRNVPLYLLWKLNEYVK